MIKNHRYKNPNGLKRLNKAFFISCSGLKSAYKNESAFRQELCVASLLFPVALILPIAILSKVLLISSMLLVLIVELLNSAIEAVVDRISLDHHELAKLAKDFGSAAVLLALLNCLVIWLGVLLTLYLVP